jgi:3'(2'), 5'-bisphosphate nucleotidase
MLELELETALNLARRASKSILQYYETGVSAESKIGADNFAEPVTAADREASRIIVEGLDERFPNDGVLSEEEDDVIVHRLGRERVWIIDPIDGTAGFIKKDGDFAIQIGLAESGVPVLGVVLLPHHDRAYYAIKGNGAFLINGEAPAERLTVSTTTNFGDVSIAVSRNHRSKKMSRIMQEFGFKREVQRGSVGLKVGLIAETTCDLYIHLSPRTKLWDTCAPQVILTESGGRLTDLWGEQYRYDRSDVQNWGGIIASNGFVHEEVVRRMKPLLAEFGRENVATA